MIPDGTAGLAGDPSGLRIVDAMRAVSRMVYNVTSSPPCTSQGKGVVPAFFDPQDHTMTEPIDRETPPATDPAQAKPAETSVQRALRMKQAVIDARPKAPRGGRFQREQSASIASGKSKPWMQR